MRIIVKHQFYQFLIWFYVSQDSLCLLAIILLYRCDTLQDGLYSDPDNCSKMFWCSNGHLSRLTCPAGLLFDTTLGVCNFFMESNRYAKFDTIQP